MATVQEKCDEQPCKIKSSRHMLRNTGAISSRSRMLRGENWPPKTSPPKEFTSLYQSQRKGASLKNSIPAYAVSSHNDSKAIKRQPLLSVFPSMSPQVLRWRPFIETASLATKANDPTLPFKEQYYRNNYTTPSCPSKTTTGHDAAKELLKAFCNQSTMTPNIKDASCGSSHILNYYSEIYDACANFSSPTVSNSMFAERSCPRQRRKSCNPPSILKKAVICEEFNGSACKGPLNDEGDAEDEQVRDNDEEELCDSQVKYCESCSRAFSLTAKCIEKDVPQKKDNSYRKTLYNEGINDDAWTSDCGCDEVPQNNMRSSRCSRGRRRDCSTDRKKSCEQFNSVYIPFSHIRKSKYHEDCKKSYGPEVYRYPDKEDPCRLTDCPFRKPKPRCNSPLPMLCRARCVSLPRKVITSEKNISDYIKVKRPCIRKVTR